MDINSIPDIFQSKLRISIIACLMTGEKTFKEVKEITKATDGNLSVQMSKMEDGGYIEVYKDFHDNKPRTRYNLTEEGRSEFIDYVNTLESVIKQYSNKDK
ncbi:winged helix-turn-helix domain-containing protein [Clostridium sp. 'White wine YQ']|uniref:winged helix-turn-helix domain-containing protein n=1 Tax=Clostridium sp. 'White wine YQ' TaxID=3027474 RepID=UPI00236619CE|nr:transcriptional regulator [Clostridium sp. 'White wine YQ']MDD7795506.1 transcriptional regulator [Clostridium sp. 'White wine YQ']